MYDELSEFLTKEVRMYIVKKTQHQTSISLSAKEVTQITDGSISKIMVEHLRVKSKNGQPKFLGFADLELVKKTIKRKSASFFVAEFKIAA